MNTTVLIRGLVAGVIFFLLGGLFFGFLLADVMGQYTNPSCMRSDEDMDVIALITGNLVMGFLASYLISRFNDVNNFSSGLRQGALIGLLFGLSLDLIWYGTSTIIIGLTGILIDVVVIIVMWGIVGGVLGWWKGRS